MLMAFRDEASFFSGFEGQELQIDKFSPLILKLPTRTRGEWIASGPSLSYLIWNVQTSKGEQDALSISGHKEYVCL